jgi:hypothetical protein
MSSRVTSRPKTNPPTWAKNATPPPLALALNEPAGEVEQKVAKRAVGVFDVLAEDGQEQHVAQDVVPAAVQEHGGDPAQPRTGA